MLENLVTVLLSGIGAYLGCGVLIAVLFLARWIRSFDPSAQEGSWGFRVLVAPGVMMLWPVILAKVLRGRAEGGVETPVRPESLRRRHALAFIAIAILGPLLFAAALGWRTVRLDDAPPVERATKLNTR